MKYVTRETGNLLWDSLRRITTRRRQRWPSVKPGQGSGDRDGGSTDGVERMTSRAQTRSTRPTAGDNVETAAARTAVRGRDEAQSLAATIRQDVRPTNSLRRTVSMATHVNGSTSGRSPTTPVDTQFSSGTHSDGSALARPSGNSDSH